MKYFHYGVWRLNKSIGQVYVPEGAQEKGQFVVEHPWTKDKVEVQLAGTQFQSGDLIHIDESGIVQDVYSDEERGWFWYSLGRSGILIFLTSFVVSYLLEFGIEESGPNGKMSYLGWQVSPSTAVTTSLLISFFMIALMSPIVGAWADFTSHRKSMLGSFAVLGICCTFALAAVFHARNLTAALILAYSIIFFYEISVSLISAYLPEIAPPKKIAKLSGYSVVLTTTSQVLALIFVVPLMSIPGNVEDVTTSDSGVKFYLAICTAAMGGLWAVGTMLTLLLMKARPCRRQLGPSQSIFTVGFIQLAQVGKKTRMYPQLFRFLLSFVLNSTAFGTITSMASIILSSDFGWSGSKLAYLLVFSQIVGMTGGFTAHRLANKFGIKRVLLSVLAVYAIACPILCSLYYFRAPCILDGWSPCETTGKCYRHFDKPLPLFEASEFCRTNVRASDQGQVAAFRSVAEMTCGETLCTSNECWVGRRFLTDWSTLDDESSPLSFWFTPNATEPFPEQGNCIAMQANSFWTDVACGSPRPFVCEKDLVQEASTLVTAAMFVMFLLLTYFAGLNVALSRAYVALMIPPDLEAEAYGLYSFCGKVLIWFGVALFALVNEMLGDFRWGFVLMTPFFLLGAWNLMRVDDEQVQSSVKGYMLARHKALSTCVAIAEVKFGLDA